MTAVVGRRTAWMTRRMPVAALIVLTRLAGAVAAVAGSWTPLSTGGDGTGGVGPAWLRAWTTYDANWYIAIAQSGYRGAPETAFFPLLPMLMRLLAPVVRVLTGSSDQRVSLALAGIIISTVSFAAAMVIIHAELADRWNDAVANRTVLTMALLPFALTWQAVYTESLTLLLAAAMWRAIHRRHARVAVVCGLALGATRSIGIPVGLGLLTAHVAWPLAASLVPRWWSSRTLGSSARRPHRGHDAEPNPSTVMARRIDWFVEPAAGLGALCSSTAVLVWLGRVGGGVAAQGQFGRARSWPWVPVWRDLTGVGGYQVGSITSLLAIAIGLAYLAARGEPVAWRVAVAVMLMMHLVMARQVPAFTIGAARYMMPMYPVWAWLARRSMPLSRSLVVCIGSVLAIVSLGCAYAAGQGAFNLG